VESKAAASHKKIAEEGYEEYTIVTILPAVRHSFEGQPHEEEIRQ